jgi:hypothetical protein
VDAVRAAQGEEAYAEAHGDGRALAVKQASNYALKCAQD